MGRRSVCARQSPPFLSRGREVRRGRLSTANRRSAPPLRRFEPGSWTSANQKFRLANEREYNLNSRPVSEYTESASMRRISTGSFLRRSGFRPTFECSLPILNASGGAAIRSRLILSASADRCVRLNRSDGASRGASRQIRFKKTPPRKQTWEAVARRSDEVLTRRRRRPVGAALLGRAKTPKSARSHAGAGAHTLPPPPQVNKNDARADRKAGDNYRFWLGRPSGFAHLNTRATRRTSRPALARDPAPQVWQQQGVARVVSGSGLPSGQVLHSPNPIGRCNSDRSVGASKRSRHRPRAGLPACQRDTNKWLWRHCVGSRRDSAGRKVRNSSVDCL